MPIVRIPAVLTARTGGQRTIEVDGGTVGEALDVACRQFPDLRILFDADGGLRSGFLIGVNLKEELATLSDAVEPEDTIVVVAAVAGGRRTP
ncbi:MAG: molybdopterin synthase sulfur carrier subunit [Actinomycetota bacterium]